MTHICIIAGEPSGDFLGAKLIDALKDIRPQADITGIGGHQMESVGLQSLFSYQQLAVMGIAEILPRLPSLIARIRQTINHIKETKPDIVVTIDSPDFCFRVLKALRKEMKNPPKLIHYVAPTVWAWREGRAKKISRFLDGLVCLFDFEPPYFERYGLKTIAAGHPLVEGDAMTASGILFRENSGIPADAKVAGVLFGSRKGEIKRTAPVLRDAVFKMAQGMEVLPHIVAPTLPHLYEDVMGLLKTYPGHIHIPTDPSEKWNAFKSMDVAVAVSGTVGLELAALKIPHVIGYKTNILTAEIVRRLIKVDYVHLANIMMGAPVVPEFLQDRCKAEDISLAANELLRNSTGQVSVFDAIASRLGYGQEKTPSQRAAAFVLSYLEK